ncbi:MAG TPA: F0F1 ATP synthase subunit B' [Beijerinckiaceae bacterium]|jgi:F-type H+-transporting ATPase subunit b|nr:F0F1 ATP synthase subunit B' [Beijerinckiaceae bacterium]
MPQLDVSTFVPQLVWLAITFIALYVLMVRVGVPAVSKVIDERRGRIGGDLDNAQKMKTEAEAILAAYEAALADARRAAQDQLRQAVDKLHAEAAERQRETAQALQQEIAAAEARIAEARKVALADLGGVATDVTRAVTQKLVGIEVAAEDAARTVESVLREHA